MGRAHARSFLRELISAPRGDIVQEMWCSCALMRMAWKPSTNLGLQAHGSDDSFFSCMQPPEAACSRDYPRVASDFPEAQASDIREDRAGPRDPWRRHEVHLTPGICDGVYTVTPSTPSARDVLVLPPAVHLRTAVLPGAPMHE